MYDRLRFVRTTYFSNTVDVISSDNNYCKYAHHACMSCVGFQVYPWILSEGPCIKFPPAERGSSGIMFSLAESFG